jgi:ribosomal-protein-alanine N-acetyltransferase
MTIAPLTSPNKKQMRELIDAVIKKQGLLPQFYWPKELLGAELATAEAFGIFEEEQLRAFLLYRDLTQAWEVSLVVCHPDYLRQGWTQKLLEKVIAAKGQGRELWLEVHEENVPAQKLYEKLGFKEVRRRPRYYTDEATAILYSYHF